MFHKLITGDDIVSPNSRQISLDGKLIDIDGPITDLYSPQAKYLCDWFLSTCIKQGINGPERIPLPFNEYHTQDKYLSNVFDYLFSLVLLYTKDQSSTSK